jgi:hypothetical protein
VFAAPSRKDGLLAISPDTDKGTMRPIFRARTFLALFFSILLMLSACATGPKQAVHAFSFNGWSDKWATQVDLLEFSYGDQYQMVQRKTQPGQLRLGYGFNVNGLMPVGDFLYAKWRIKATGEIIEERVDLRKLLPSDMDSHRVTFVIDGKQLYVYLVTPTAKHEWDPPILKTTMSRYYLTYEIFPQDTYKPDSQR